MLIRRFCVVYHLFWVCATSFELLVVAAALSYTVLYWCHSNNNKGYKTSRNNSVASFIACIASPLTMQLQDGRCSKFVLTPIPVTFSVSLSLSPLRRSTRGAGGAFIQGPVQPGAPEASRGLPAPVCRAVLPGREPDPPQRCCQTSAGTQRRHPGSGSERPVRDRPGPTGDGERSDQHAHTHGEWTWRSMWLKTSWSFCWFLNSTVQSFACSHLRDLEKCTSTM